MERSRSESTDYNISFITKRTRMVRQPPNGFLAFDEELGHVYFTSAPWSEFIRRRSFWKKIKDCLRREQVNRASPVPG